MKQKNKIKEENSKERKYKLERVMIVTQLSSVITKSKGTTVEL